MKSKLIRLAFIELFPKKKIPLLKLAYSKKFKGYNAKIVYSNNLIEVRLSDEWKDVSEEIQKGLIQRLLLKLFKETKKTLHIELYDKFIKKIGRYSKRITSDIELIKLFKDLNEQYFNSNMDQPNLKFGQHNFTKLGSYSYEDDLVIISSILKPNPELVKFVLYHELLHKKHGIKRNSKRNSYHGKLFREEEKKYENPAIEKQLTSFIKRKRIKKATPNFLKFFRRANRNLFK